MRLSVKGARAAFSSIESLLPLSPSNVSTRNAKDSVLSFTFCLLVLIDDAGTSSFLKKSQVLLVMTTTRDDCVTRRHADTRQINEDTNNSTLDNNNNSVSRLYTRHEKKTDKRQDTLTLKTKLHDIHKSRQHNRIE